MRPYKKITLTILLLAYFVFPSRIFALSCEQQDPSQAIHDYEAVFIGKVISSSDLTKNTKLEVVQSWKGVDKTKVKIYDFDDWSLSSVGIRFPEKQEGRVKYRCQVLRELR